MGALQIRQSHHGPAIYVQPAVGLKSPLRCPNSRPFQRILAPGATNVTLLNLTVRVVKVSP